MICKAENTVIKYNMFENTSEIVVGFSGGADSSALLYILKHLSFKYGYKLKAAHVNHCLRGDESERDEQFVRDFCKQNDIELFVLRADVSEESKKFSMGIEEYGRKIRYEFFNSLCGEKGKIATAHNLNDCEETFFLNLFRGSGLKGISSIPPVRGRIIRPLIDCTRDEIEKFCSENNISFVTDSSNLSDDYLRNKIRHNVIPVLKEISPNLDTSMLRCFENLRLDREYFDEKISEIIKRSKIGDYVYDISSVFSLHPAVRNRFIGQIIFDFCGNYPEKKHIDLVAEILHGGTVQVNNGLFCKVKNNILTFYYNLPENKSYETEINNNTAKTPYGILNIKTVPNTQKINNQLFLFTFDYDKIRGNLVVRSRNEKDKISLPKRKVTKTLKKLFIEEKIEVSQRNKIPIIADDFGVVWVKGFGADARCKVDENTKNIAIVEYAEE